jgi:hypothetical protein
MRSKILLAVLLSLVLSGCGTFTDSEVLEEQAEVIQLSYVPSQTSDVGGIAPSVNFSDGSIGMGLVMASSTSPEVWAVVLRCENHNQTFALKSKELYNKVKAGDKVTLRYVEHYFTPDDHKDKRETVGVHTTQVLFNDDTRIER